MVRPMTLPALCIIQSGLSKNREDSTQSVWNQNMEDKYVNIPYIVLLVVLQLKADSETVRNVEK